MDPRLVQNDMRHFGQPVLDILNAAGSNDIGGGFRIGLPERCFIDPVGFVHHTVSKPERLEHLHGPAGHTIRLAAFHRSRFLFQQNRLDIGELRQLRGKGKACRATADYDNIGGCRKVITLFAA